MSEERALTREWKLLKELTEHEGYSIAKGKMAAKLSVLIDIANLELDLDPNRLAIEVRARQLASQLIHSFFKDDIEGTIEQGQMNNPLTLKGKSYIVSNETDESPQTPNGDSSPI